MKMSENRNSAAAAFAQVVGVIFKLLNSSLLFFHPSSDAVCLLMDYDESNSKLTIQKEADISGNFPTIKRFITLWGSTVLVCSSWLSDFRLPPLKLRKKKKS
jgi:hypothetical protein